jgi:hypothetical protein
MQRREKIFWLAVGFVLIVGFISLIPAHGEICKEAEKAQQEPCTSYRLVPFLVIEIGKILDALGVAVAALATIFIAWFTLSLRQSTDKLWDAGERQLKLLADTSAAQSRDMQGSIKAAESAAIAAQVSADAAVAVERARFYVVINDNFINCINAAANWSGPKDQEDTPLRMEDWPMAGIVFKNYGKTPGIIEEVGTGIDYSETVPIPVYDVKVVKENMIGAGGESETFGTVIDGEITVARAKKVRDGAANIWVYGYVIYNDVFGKRQTHRFFQRLVRVSQFRYVLQSYDHKHYNQSS